LSLGLVAVATLVVSALERGTEIPDASAVYLVAVVIVGSVAGTMAALGTAVVAFVTYDLLFTEPRFSLVVSDSSELLNLVVVLIVALAVGRLAALGRERASEADRRQVSGVHEAVDGHVRDTHHLGHLGDREKVHVRQFVRHSCPCSCGHVVSDPVCWLSAV